MTDIIDVEPIDDDTFDGNVAALAPVRTSDALVRPAASVADVESAFRDYQRLCSQLLDNDDVQVIGGRSFRKKSAWRKLAVAFGVSCEVIDRQYERDDNGRTVRAEVVVRATAPNGRHMDGLGICDLTERKFSKPEHDIPATAMTRATNRACADLFGMGEVSAEEIIDHDTYAAPSNRPARAARSTSAQPTTTVDADTTTHVTDAIGALSDAYKDEWKQWRTANGVPWPIVTGDAKRVRDKVRELVERAARDEEPF